MIIDATDSILGRLATHVAKNSLNGEEVLVINCEKAFITGNKNTILAKYKRKKSIGTHKGPFMPRMPDRFVKRIIRGMIPYKTNRGREAFARIKCYVGVPEKLKGKAIKLDYADIGKIQYAKSITIGEICKEMGGRVE